MDSKIIFLFKKIFKIFSVNIILILSFILFVEIFFGYWFDKDNLGPYMREHRMKNQRILWKDETEELTYFYKRNYYGFRGVDINPSKIKGIIMGSSVIDERYKPEKYTITEFLNNRLKEDNFNTVFVNAGIEGQSSAGIVASFERWLFKLENFSPEYILFYIGLSDSRHQNTNVADDNAGHLLNPEKKDIFFDNIKSRSIIYDSIRKIKFKYLPRKGFVKHDGKIGENYKSNYNYINYSTLVEKHTLNPSTIENNKKISFYLKRIDKLNEYSKRLKSTPIFITNIGSNGYDLNLYRYNQSLINHCVLREYKCIDLAKKIKPNIEYWYDDQHTTKKGSSVIAKLIFEELKKIVTKKN
tara:strand:+ start:161 stop:1228 length:1068 start_codon:yes stop_codon:yes gene_type:complete